VISLCHPHGADTEDGEWVSGVSLESNTTGVIRNRVDVTERPVWQAGGFLGLSVGFSLLLLSPVAFVAALLAAEDSVGAAVGLGAVSILLFVGAIVVFVSLVVIQPGKAWVVQFFGTYVGTARRTGLVWLAPFTTRRALSVRVCNFETARLKVNDLDGNPVDIAAIVVWQVRDTARASFAVDAFVKFVEVQAEAALRHVARSYSYDAPDGSESLRGSTDTLSEELAKEVNERIAVAGVEIIEVRISHLAYAAEIAQAMLQRQQAAAVVAARTKIVEGAVGMVQLALDRLAEEQVVELDEERKAAMVSNLLVVLCGDSRVTPIVNTGTLYQ
jgi:regulator of protease activity HflC (stomatin/prohibitin superfamily)